MTSAPVTSTVVLDAGGVLSSRHLPSLMMLALSAGAVNAGGLMDCKRFVTHVTGTVTRIGLDVGEWTLMLEYTVVLAAFVFGAMASVIPLHLRVARGRPPAPGLALGAVAAILVAVATIGHGGGFGVFGGHPEDPEDFAFMAVLAFAMGLMNATVASTTALAVRTTHMTGPASDFGVQLALAWLHSGETRLGALRLAAFRAGTIVAFAVGAGLMVPLVRKAGHLAFLGPSLVVALATLRSFSQDAGRVASPTAPAKQAAPATR